jgi:hypothetical protein
MYFTNHAKPATLSAMQTSVTARTPIHPTTPTERLSWWLSVLVVFVLVILNPLACHIHCWHLKADQSHQQAGLFVCQMGVMPVDIVQGVPVGPVAFGEANQGPLKLVPTPFYPGVLPTVATIPSVALVLVGTFIVHTTLVSLEFTPLTPPPQYAR